jgi:uncharacterized protein (TIGR00299 family) protein
MRTLAFDGRMGAAGDMILGALVAAGADPDALAPVEAVLDVEYDVGTADRNGIAATDVTVRIGDRDGDGSHDHDPDRDDHGHHHDADGDDHGHDHDPDRDDHGHHHDPDRDDHGHDHDGDAHTRTYPEVIDLVEGMDLPEGVAGDATAVFRILGEAEAAVHGTSLGSTAFHEVGADDAVAEVVGAALLLADLSPDRVVTTPLSAGGGEVATVHGTYPVPAPAVVEVAERADWTLRGGPVEAELLTPTGAAILAHYAEGVDALPGLSVAASGYGAGDRTFPDRANVLRAVVGDGGRLPEEPIAVLETNLDDAAPELLGGLQETLAEAGARDVSVVPLTMKKSRPGHLVRVIARPEDAERVARRLAEETGTLGVRQASADHRFVARRSVESVTVAVDGREYGVDVKVATDDAGDRLDVSAEYDDALAVARETGRPVREVLRRAEAAYRAGE